MPCMCVRWRVQESSEGIGVDGEPFECISEESEIFVGPGCVATGRLVGHVFVLLGREVRCISDRAQVGDKRRIDVADCRPVDTVKEVVLLDLIHSQPLILAAYQPADEILSLPAEVHIVGEDEVVLPVNNLFVRFVCRLRAERRVANQALEHDCSERPPITLISVALQQEDLRGNVVWGTNSGISKFPSVCFPRKDGVAAGHGEVDGVDHDAVS